MSTATMKPYRKHTEVYHDLVKRIERDLASGEHVLPPEIELSRQLSTSRMTLRKALDTAVMNGLITREHKRTTINTRPYPDLRKCGKMLFVAYSVAQNCHLPAVERLWLRLLPEIRLNGGDISLLPVDDDFKLKDFREAIRQADLVFLTTHIFAKGTEEYLEEQLARNEKPFFSLFEPFFSKCPYGISMDNREAGRIAARELWQSGVRKAIVFSASLSNPHGDRIRGFRAEFTRLGGETVLAAKREGISDPVYYLACRDRLQEAYNAGCSGAFLASDEGIGIILMDLFERHLIPEKFKAVSVNGSGQALHHVPPISCVNHATGEVVAELLRQLQKWGKTTVHEPFHIRIKPSLYRTGSLGKV